MLDTNGIVVAASPGCAELLGIDPVAAIGQRLVAGVLRLLDFNPISAELPGVGGRQDPAAARASGPADWPAACCGYPALDGVTQHGRRDLRAAA